NNAPRWINLHFMLMQPSELAKIAFVLASARYLRYRESHRKFTGFLLPFAFMFVPVVLILKEPDLGGSLGFAPALLFILVAAGARLSHLISLLGVGILLVGVNVALIYTLP